MYIFLSLKYNIRISCDIRASDLGEHCFRINPSYRLCGYFYFFLSSFQFIVSFHLHHGIFEILKTLFIRKRYSPCALFIASTIHFKRTFLCTTAHRVGTVHHKKLYIYFLFWSGCVFFSIWAHWKLFTVALWLFVLFGKTSVNMSIGGFNHEKRWYLFWRNWINQNVRL